VRLATWNVNSVGARAPRVREWLEESQPDVLCLQELKCPAEAFPAEITDGLPYEVAAHGEGRWNGVAILSKVGLDDVVRGFEGQPGYAPPPGDPDSVLVTVEQAPVVEARAIGATCGGVRVWSVYVPNGRALDSPHYGYKLEWLAALRRALEAEVRSAGAFVIAGDFNVARTDADVWDPGAFTGSTHVSEPERSAVSALEELGLTDVVPRALKHGTPFTYWDYRAGMFHKNEGMRIDLVLVSERVVAGLKDAYVDREARKGKAPSDHAPVVIDFDL